MVALVRQHKKSLHSLYSSAQGVGCSKYGKSSGTRFAFGKHDEGRAAVSFSSEFVHSGKSYSMFFRG